MNETRSTGAGGFDMLRKSPRISALAAGEADSKQGPLVTIIIPTFNSARAITACLKSLEEQNDVPLEIIVVDNFSNDQTLTCVEMARHPVTVMVHSSGRAEARNVGAARASGQYVYHVDSDMVLSSHLIADCVKTCRDHSADAVIVPEVSCGTGYWARCAGLVKEIVREAPGHEAARFMRASTFHAVGGYDEELEAGEDFDLHYRLEQNGAKIARVDRQAIHDLGEISLGELIAKYRRYGKSIDLFRLKHSRRLENGHTYLRLILRKWRILARQPLEAAGFVSLAIIEFINQN